MRYVSSPILKEVRIFLPIAAAIGAALALSGCSLKPASNRTLRLEIPGGGSASVSASRMASSALQGVSVSGAPASFSEFSCYLVAVSGPGIQDDPRIGCPGPRGPIGVLNGMVPVSGGVLEVSVPAGPARLVRLMGITNTAAGCPDVNAVMEANKVQGGIEQTFPGLGKPYEIGSTTVDLFNDADVSITAAYDSSNPLKVFGDCRESGEDALPIATAYRGSEPVAQAYDYADSTPMPKTGIIDLPNATAFTPAEIALFNTLDLETAPGVLPPASNGNSYIHRVMGDGAISQRAMIQLRWDVTSLVPAEHNSLDLQLQFSGGKYGGCAVGSAGAVAGILRSDGTWDRLNIIYNQSQLNWSPAYRLAPGQYFYNPPGTNQRFVIVSIDSNIMASTAGCFSEVALAGAQLRVLKGYRTMHVSVGAPGTRYAPGTTVYPYASGGHPPYTYSADVGTVVGGAPPYYIIPNGISSAVITVTDFDGRVAQTTVDVGNYWVAGTPDMNAVRQGHRLVKLMDGRFLILGGDQAPAANTAQLFNPATGTFSATMTMLDTRNRPEATLLPDGKVWISGGQPFNSSPALLTTEIFDPGSQTFAVRASMAQYRFGHTATLMDNGKVYINGGTDLGANCWDVGKIYDPVADSYATASSAGAINHAIGYLLPDQRIALVGGYNDCLSTYNPNIKFYNRVSDTVATGPTLATPRFDHTVTMLPNGKLLIAGGLTGGGTTASVEIFDPTNDSITQPGPMSVARRGHVALLLPSGKVVFASGQNDVYPYQTAAAELYDPATGTSVPIGALTIGRSLLTGGVSNSGEVFVFGGYTYSSGETATWEQYIF